MIFKFNEEQYNMVKKYVVPMLEKETQIELDDEKRSVSVKEKKNYEDFVSSADEAIIAYGMVNQDYLTDLGVELQLLYDEIYYQTTQVDRKQLYMD